MKEEIGSWVITNFLEVVRFFMLNFELYWMVLRLSKEDDKMVIQSDSLEGIKTIHESDSKISNFILIRLIHHILSQENQRILRFIPKESLINEQIA